MHIIPPLLRLMSVPRFCSVFVDSLLIVAPVVGFCVYSMFCCVLLFCNRLDGLLYFVCLSGVL